MFEPRFGASIAAVGVCHGEDEEAFALMRCADVSRFADLLLDSEAKRFKVRLDICEVSASEMSGNILKETPSRSTFSDDPGDVGPEIAGVVESPAAAGDAERLARIARHDSVHSATPSSSIKRLEVGPDRSWRQRTFGHARSQYAAGRRFDLHIADWDSSSAASGVSTEIESSDPGGEGEISLGGTWIHIQSPRCCGGRVRTRTSPSGGLLPKRRKQVSAGRSTRAAPAIGVMISP